MEDNTPGFATNGVIADIIEEIAPILDQYPVDHKLIALAATLLIVLNPSIDLNALKNGVDLIVTEAAHYVASGMGGPDMDWDEVPASKLN